MEPSSLSIHQLYHSTTLSLILSLPLSSITEEKELMKLYSRTLNMIRLQPGLALTSTSLLQ